jgi:hypothetical protein
VAAIKTTVTAITAIEVVVANVMIVLSDQLKVQQVLKLQMLLAKLVQVGVVKMVVIATATETRIIKIQSQKIKLR